jgi:hypothetical protein
MGTLWNLFHENKLVEKKAPNRYTSNKKGSLRFPLRISGESKVPVGIFSPGTLLLTVISRGT